MNIALVIFPFHPSHGCILQTFALYSKLKELGHDVSIINRKNQPISDMVAFRRGISNMKGRLRGAYQGPLFYKGNSPKAIMQNLQPFIESAFGNDIKTVYSQEETCGLVQGDSFDAYIVGSDQVWRPKYVPDVYHFFLGFVPVSSKAKRIAFCPSFGTDEWEYSEEQTKRCKLLIGRFDRVAVREESGVKLCEEMFNKTAVHLLDPTVLLKPEEYRKAVNLELRNSPENVLSYYYLDNTEEKLKILHRISEVLGSKENRINTDTENNNARLQDRIAPSLQTWIGGFAKSKFVVADSFHATMFAIIFNTPFITVANKERGLSRFESLLKTFGLEDRMVTSIEGVTDDLIQTTIDWARVNNSLQNERERSMDFIKTSLSNTL